METNAVLLSGLDGPGKNAISLQAVPDWIYAYVWTYPDVYNGFHPPPSSFRRHRPHPDLQNLPPQGTLRWWRIFVLSTSFVPAAAETVDGHGLWPFAVSHEDVIATEFFYTTVEIDITQMLADKNLAS